MVAARQLEDENTIVVDHPLARVERPLTEDDFWALPDDDNRYEIIRGELYVTPPPSIDHQLASSRLHGAFIKAIDDAGLGIALAAPTAVRLTPIDLPQPDLLIVSNERLELVEGRKFVAGAPDLVVEILSPSNRRQDLVTKRGQYQLAGIPEYWIVDPLTRTIEILVLEGEHYREVPTEGDVVRSRRFPTIEVEVSRLLRGIDPTSPTTPSTTG